MFKITKEEISLLEKLAISTKDSSNSKEISNKYDCGSQCSGKCGGTCQAACKSSCTSLF